MLRLYDCDISGNAYKVRLLLSQLGIAFERAQATQWLFFEQYSHEPYIAVVRFWHLSQTLEQHRSELAERVEQGYEALGVMKRHLAGHDFLAGGRYSVADIALFAYTHVAHEGGFELGGYANLNAWLARVESQAGYVGITEA